MSYNKNKLTTATNPLTNDDNLAKTHFDYAPHTSWKTDPCPYPGSDIHELPVSGSDTYQNERLSAFLRGVPQPGVAMSSRHSAANPCPPVYAPTVLPSQRKKRASLTRALARLFMPELPPAVSKTMETVSLTATEEDWEMIDWDECFVDRVEGSVGYRFDQADRMAVTSLLAVISTCAPPSAHGWRPAAGIVPASLASEACGEARRPIGGPLPAPTAQLPYVRFSVLPLPSTISWSAHSVQVMTFSPAAAGWDRSATLAPGTYELSARAVGCGLIPVTLTAVDTAGRPTGAYSVDILETTHPYPLIVTLNCDTVLQPATSTTQAEVVVLSVYIRSAAFYRHVGVEQPMWVSDIPPSPPRSSSEHDALSQSRLHNLTAEGVEANPGPSILADHYVALAKTRRLDYTVLAIMDQLSDNRFNLLSLVLEDDTPTQAAALEELLLEEDPSDQEPPAARKSQGGSRKPKAEQRDQPPAGPPRQQSTDHPVHKQWPKDPLKAMADRRAAILRVGQSLRDPTFAARFARRIPTYSRKFMTAVAAAAWGIGWDSAPTLTPIQLAIYAANNRMSNSELLSSVFDAVPPPASTPGEKGAQGPSNVLYWTALATDFANLAYVEASARVHNKEMHSANGNIFVTKMKEVDDSPQIHGLMRGESNNPALPTSSNALVLSNVYSANSMLRNPQEGSGFRSDIIDDDGRIVQNARTHYPSSALQLLAAPRYSKATDAIWASAQVQSAPRLQGLSYLNVQLNDYYAHPLEASTLANFINAQIQNAGAYKTRETDITNTGFSMSDLEDLNSFLPLGGISFERPITMLTLLHSLIKHSDVTNIPPSCFFNQSDTIKKGNDSEVEFMWFDPADWTGDMPADSVTAWPFDGRAGKLRFHATLQTVPADRRATAVFAPAAILGHADSEPRVMALYIMSLVQWPFCMPKYVVRQPAQGPSTWRTPVESTSPYYAPDTAYFPANSEVMAYALNHTTVNIPGPRDLDIVLPRKASARIPRSQDEANQCVIMNPKSGPTALARGQISYAANQPLGVNYMGGPESATSITDYLNSWLPTMSDMNIVSMLSVFNQLWGVDHHITTAWYNTIALVHRFPPLMTGQRPPLERISGAPPNFELERAQVNVAAHYRVEADVLRDLPSGAGAQEAQRADALAELLECGGSLCGGSVQDGEPTVVHYCDLIHTEASELYTIMASRTLFADVLTERGGFALPIRDYDPTVNFHMYNFDMMAWNKVLTGLATSADISGGNSMSIQPQLVDRMYVHTEMNEVNRMAVPIHMFMSWAGISNEPGRDAHNWVAYPRLRSAILGLFVNRAIPLVFKPGPVSKVLNSLYAAVFNCSLPTSILSLPSGADKVTTFGRWHYQPMAAVYRDDRAQSISPPAGVQGDIATPMKLYSPGFLPDVWMHIYTQKNPLSMQNFPAPFGMEGPAGFTQGLKPLKLEVSYVTPYLDPATLDGYYPSNHLPTQKDESGWNTRLLVATCLPYLSWRFVTGPLPDDSYVPGALPQQINPAQPEWVTTGQKALLTASTFLLPVVWGDGRRVFPCVDPVHGTQAARVQLRLSRASLPAWLVGTTGVNDPNDLICPQSTDALEDFLSEGASTVEATPPPPGIVSQAAVPEVATIHQHPPPQVDGAV